MKGEDERKKIKIKPGHVRFWEPIKYTKKKSQKGTQNVINKTCIYMQKNEEIIHGHILLLDIRLWLKKFSFSF